MFQNHKNPNVTKIFNYAPFTMNKNTLTRLAALTLSGGVVMVVPMSVFAGLVNSGDMGQFGTFAKNFGQFLNALVVPLMYALCFLFFLWGIFQYFIAGGANEEKRAQGRQFIIYAVIGFVAITALWAIVAFVYDTLGLDATGTSETSQFKQPNKILFSEFAGD